MTHIAFLLGSPAISGGTNVIFEHGSGLQKRGYEVTILTAECVDPEYYSWHPDAGSLCWKRIDDVLDVEFDFVVATWWQSVELLERLRSRYYVYFIQSIESRFFPPKNSQTFEGRDIDIMAEWCESTYRYPLQIVTEARWIQQYLLERYNRQAELVLNGIKKEIFCEEGDCAAEPIPGRLRVLVEGPLGVFYKNVERTIELCVQAGVPEIWLLSSSDISSYSGVDRCFSRVPITKTAEIYRSCDVLVKLSYVEGMFGPPLEMFHCGGTALVYDVTGHDEYINNGVNAIVVAKDHEDEVVAWLKRLQQEPALLARLKDGARKTASDWPDWGGCAERFAAALNAFARLPESGGRRWLKEHNAYYLNARDNHFKSREMARFAEREQLTAAGNGRCLNYVQIYWDDGRGMSREIVKEYSTGEWQKCRVTIPVERCPVTLRLDPSVRVGIVALRKLRVSDAVTGVTLQEYTEHSDWGRMYFSGTLVCLRYSPYPVLESYGEDPQMILPEIRRIPGNGGVTLDVELCEMSFGEALQRYSSLGEQKRTFRQRMSTALSLAVKGQYTL
jgi:glycosyltransferase involved in cell wall biosynthesis